MGEAITIKWNVMYPLERMCCRRSYRQKLLWYIIKRKMYVGYTDRDRNRYLWLQHTCMCVHIYMKPEKCTCYWFLRDRKVDFHFPSFSNFSLKYYFFSFRIVWWICFLFKYYIVMGRIMGREEKIRKAAALSLAI